MRPIVMLLSLMIAASAVGGCRGRDTDIGPYLVRAKALKESGESAKAVVELRNALKLQPRDPQANLLLAQIEDDAGDLKSAVGYYVLAASVEARLLEPQLRLTELLIDANRLDDALARINTTLGAYPNDARALALRADVEQQQGQTNASRADVAAALQRDPVNARALAVSAQLDLAANNLQAAQTALDRGLARHPDDVRLLQVKASLYLTQNQPDKAADALKAMVRASPKNIIALGALSEVEATNGHYDEALERLRVAVAANPTNESLQTGFVGFLAQHGSPDDVLAQLNKLIAAHLEESTYDLLLAEYHRSRGQLDKTRDVLQSARKRLGDRPTGLDAGVALAKLDLQTGKLGAADQELSTVLKLAPDHVEALLTSAILASNNGRPLQAIDRLLAAVRVDPLNGRAFQLLASQYLLTGQPKLSVDAMQRATSISPDDEDAAGRLAIFLQNAGQNYAAKELMARLTLRHPNSPRIWAYAARLAVLQKDFADAARSVGRLRSIQGASALAAALDGQVKAVQGNYGAASKALRSAIAEQSSIDPETIESFAQVSVSANDAEDAARFLQQRTPSLTADAQRAARMAVMRLWSEAKNVEQTDAAFADARRATPDDLNLYRLYVSALVSRKDFGKAGEVIKTGIASGVPEWSLLILLGSVDLAKGDMSAAMSRYKAAAELNPNSVEAANNYASLLSDQDPSNKASIEQARSMLSGLEKSDNASLIDTIAWLDYRLGRFEEAKLLLTKIDASKSANPQIRFHMAAVLIASGNRELGLALLETVKGLSFSGADEVRALSAS